MKRLLHMMLLGLLATTAFAAPPARPTPTTAPAPKKDYAITTTFDLGGEGLLDAITVDPEGKLIFLPGNTRTLVVDAATGKTLHQITGQGMTSVALAPSANRGFITSTKENAVVVFDLKTYAILGKIPVGEEPGNILYDDASKKILLCSISAKALIPIAPDVDLKNPRTEPPIELGEKPDSLVADGLGMVYVTVKERDNIMVVDTRIMRRATQWGINGWYRPSGITLDRLRSRLFIACKSRVAVISATDGHLLADVTVGAGVDGMAFRDGRALCTTAEGILTVIGQDAQGKFVVQQTLDTALAVKTVAVNPKTGVLYLPAAEMKGKKTVPNTFRLVVLDNK